MDSYKGEEFYEFVWKTLFDNKNSIHRLLFDSYIYIAIHLKEERKSFTG